MKTPVALVLLVTALTTGFTQGLAAKNGAQTKPPQKRVVKSRSPKTTADSELNLRDIHKEHAESDERMVYPARLRANATVQTCMLPLQK